MVIEFDKVGKTFRDGTSAVSDLSLTVPSDRITVFVGPSGCGKTTTLRMVNRMLEPTRGTITWDGKPLKSRRKTTLRRQMGYVIQSGGLFPHRTVLDNVGTVPRPCCAGRGRRSASGRCICSARWAWTARWRTVTRPSCPVASSSGWEWPGRSPPTPWYC